MYTVKIYWIAFLFLLSCTSLDTRNKEKSLAKVYEKDLYLSDVRDIFPSGISGQDSLLILQNYVDKWIKKQLILQKAELNLTEGQDVHISFKASAVHVF